MAELLKMPSRELSRLFRKKAMQIHPDLGGDHDEFVCLTEAYDEVLSLRDKK